MQIPPSNVSGLAGLQSAQSGLTQATIDVAKPASADLKTDETRPVEEVDQTQALVSAIEAEQQGEAAVEVIETSSETLGTIINLEV
ncbi:chemotaxis protein [Shewanella psychropiezotolerans]|uniref:Chemotaxis protein n=1 Tax=Shewanella psychropiezotolerans TaxID=2593655 RepID=A0ABX5X1N6_9GAMM|nr:MULTISPECIES: chemotaxis protein [Shewanella]MPY24135.1 chemotaxis protein [Shewanella sp. YLB-07]QDO84367.1 chemotaxis protein [Shewanella psychropiezotolerans]